MDINTVFFIIILSVSILGLVMGIIYYIKPDMIVNQRMKKHSKYSCEDKELQYWFGQEFNRQVKQTKRLGLMIVIFEAFWLILVFAVFKTKYFQ